MGGALKSRDCSHDCVCVCCVPRHEAERLEQKAKGALERQKITDEAEAEKARKELLELQANSAAVESTGQAKAEAQSRAEAAKIEGEAAVEQARLKAQASKIEAVREGAEVVVMSQTGQSVAVRLYCMVLMGLLIIL